MELKRTNLNDKITDTIDDFNDNWTNIEDGLELKANKQQEALITPTLLNGHSAIDSSRRPRFRKNDFGQLVMTGGFISGNNNLPIFVLPLGHRPDRPVNIVVFDTLANAKRLLIDVNGVVRLFTASTGTFYLENITIELDVV